MLSLLTRGGDLVGSPLNDFWRKGRKFATTMTGASAISQWEPVLAHEVKRMVCNMVKDTSRYEFWFEALSSAVSIRQNFGISLSTDEEIEHHVNSIMAHAHEIESRAPGSYLVDLIPAMMHLPEALAPFKREASQVYDRSFSYFRGLVEEACLKYEKKIPETPKSFARCWLEKEDRYGLSYTEAVWVMGTLYAAGTGTTSGTMRSFCLAMCHHPEWMQKLNEELDRVVGPDRLPTLQDYGALPNVRAVIKETLRWRPVVAASTYILRA
jgi:cytochrome P450